MFGPYDKKFDKNKNGIMEDDEKLEEQAYIRYLAEKMMKVKKKMIMTMVSQCRV